MLADGGAIDSWEGLYPHTSSACSPYTAIRMMAQLLAATRDTSIYHLTDIHWLLLYECLQNFCSIHNDLVEDDPQDLRTIGTFRIGQVDEEALVNIYFWDTDFLLRSLSYDDDLFANDEFNEEPESEMTQDLLDDSEEADIPLLETVEDVAWIVPDSAAFFRTGSIEYPDMQE